VNNLTKIKTLSREEKELKYNQKTKVFWFLGLSSAGKSTLAQKIEQKLFDDGFIVVLLDGDNIRLGINDDLLFTLGDRLENIRRIAEISKLFINNGIIVLNSFITPTEKMRKIAKNILGDDYIEVYINASLELCENRDIKGLYKKARAGEIKNFTGVDSIFEEPISPDIIVDSSKDIDYCVELLYNKMIDIITYS